VLIRLLKIQNSIRTYNNRIHTDTSHAAKKQRRLAAGDAQALGDKNE
jgi:hypothetical protein